jgi:hypothetical protein
VLLRYYANSIAHLVSAAPEGDTASAPPLRVAAM